MKTTVYYLANRTMDIDIPAEYDEILKASFEELQEVEKNISVTELIEYIDDYIRQIDPDFVESCGMTGENLDWEW